MDKLTTQQRHFCMSRIKGKDTKPELIVRKFLYNHGIRYRLHKDSLPGKPDIVISKQKIAIFVNGCFWHGHENCKHYTIPKSNIDYWKEKIQKNRKRDARNYFLLSKLGWKNIVIWECQLSSKQREDTLMALLVKINIAKCEQACKQTKAYTYDENDFVSDIAAEEGAKYGEDENNSHV